VATRTIGRRPIPGRSRLVLFGLALAVAWLGLGYRLYQIQVVKAEDYAERGLEQRLISRKLAASRGAIFDRNGELLAVTVDSESIYAVPSQLTDPVLVAQQLAPMLGEDYETLAERLETTEPFVYIRRQVEPKLADAVRNLQLPGLFLQKEPKRVYPSESVAANVVGMVDIDGNGLEGLEKFYDEQLRGVPGEARYEMNRHGDPIPQGRNDIRPAVPGVDLFTTIDSRIQFAALEACRDQLKVTDAERCSVVVLDVESGEVLAMVTYPDFDPMTRKGAKGTEFDNYPVRAVYEPGSTQKLVTLAAALEEHVVEPKTVISGVADRLELRNGACKSDSDEVHGCYRDFKSHRTVDLTVQDIFTQSSNVGTIMISQLLEEGTLGEYMDRFGQGRKTGIDFGGEAPGAINLGSDCLTCAASAAIGYSVSVSLTQMAAAYASVGNDGEWLQPHLVAEVVDTSGQRHTVVPKVRTVVSADTAWLLRQLLGNVVEDGTGQRAAVEGYTVGGKTGTANKVKPGGGYSDVTVASFVGMAPLGHPQVVVAVAVDAPSFQFRTGASAAAPVFAAVMEHALHQMGVPPDLGAGDG